MAWWRKECSATMIFAMLNRINSVKGLITSFKTKRFDAEYPIPKDYPISDAYIRQWFEKSQ